MSSGSSQPSKTTQTTTSQPWAGQEPYLRELFSRAQAQGPQQYFSGQQVASPSQATQEGQSMALSAVPGMKQGSDAAQASMLFNLGGGRDVANNPYLQSAIQAAMNPVIQNFKSVGGPESQIRGHFTGSSSGGSGTREGIAQGIAQRGLGQSLADMSSGMTMQAYTQAQDNAVRTLGLAPQTLQMGAMPAQLTSAVGGQRDAYTQALIDAEMAKFNFEQQAPWQNIQNFQGAIGGNFGQSGTSQTTAPAARTNPLMAGLGGAAAGGALAGMLPMAGLGPWGMGIGALLGLMG